MSSDCNNRNPLQRSGVNQYQRVLNALLPSHVQVDERDDADLILFAKNYAKQLKYFTTSNVADGDWSPLMSMDISVTLASLVKLDSKGCFSYVKDIFDKIQSTDSSQVGDLKNQFKVLFDFTFSITALLDEYYKAIPVNFEFKEILGNAIHSNLPEYYDRLKKYYDEAIIQTILDPTSTFVVEPAPVEIVLSQNFDPTVLSAQWTDISIPTFSPTFNGSTIALKIKNTSTHNLFTGIFDQYLKTLASIVDTAAAYLKQTLTSFPTHSPHYALFLTFIKLFKFAQNHLNTFTTRHLDLYYKDILRLRNNDAEPDRVHLTFELAKPVENALVKKDTVFKAGKDIDGEEIFYAATEEVVLNKGTVKSLKNILAQKVASDSTRQIFAGTVANSEDGLGAKLESVDKSWKTFGSNDRQFATVGFAMSSHYLYLTEGTRTITFTFFAPAGEQILFEESDINQLFTLQLTGEKAWVDVPIQLTDVIIDASKEFFKITVTLDGGVSSIVPYSEKIHKLNLKTSLPVAKFVVNEAKAKETVWDFGFEKVGIDVAVSGMKDLAIQNDAGTLSPSKPFELFGASPHLGSSFIVGNKELFMKTLQPQGTVNATLSLTWDDYSDLISKISAYDNPHKVNAFHLVDSIWKQTAQGLTLFEDHEIFFSGLQLAQTAASSLAQTSSIQRAAVQKNVSMDFESSLFEASNVSDLGLAESLTLGLSAELASFKVLSATSLLNVSLPKLDVTTDFTDNQNYDVKSVWGFLKLDLAGKEFGHSTYAEDVANAAKSATITSTTDSSGKTTTTISMTPVPEPYTPKVKEISLSYTASTLIDFATDEEAVYLHLTPFGYKDVSVDIHRMMLPDFANEGELFIGVENFVTDQTLSLLFQVAEGSADPLTTKQEMIWYFLGAGNEWIEFEKEDIADATNDLTQSGIIRFSLSGTAVLENTLMTDQLHWLRGVVVQKTNAVCKLIDVVAQAIQAQFYDYKNLGSYFKAILPASTISKAVISDSAIKKITQAYASFGGRQKETDDHFYVRVSERLRHKNRGISMWDYERLVLEAFPTIYKVKCINHTQIIEKTIGGTAVYIDNELKPGSVVVVTIPDLQNKNAFDPLRPYTSLGVLTTIRQYLYQLISPHVNLDVRNPRFEEIQLEFSIKYLVDENEFYTKQLKEELEQFMAPWAYDLESDIEFGGKISKSVLINFIEERSYVDYLSCVKMYQIVEGIKSSDLEEAQATSARSVFVSVKSDDATNAHAITFITTTECVC